MLGGISPRENFKTWAKIDLLVWDLSSENKLFRCAQDFGFKHLGCFTIQKKWNLVGESQPITHFKIICVVTLYINTYLFIKACLQFYRNDIKFVCNRLTPICHTKTVT